MTKQKHISIISVSVTVLIILILAYSCSTKKNTITSRMYHNLTGYYNVYYNGKEAFKKGMKTIDDSHKDNYSLLLPVFKYSNDETTRAAFGDMNRALEKGGKCVRKHSITVPPKKDKKKKKKSKKRKKKGETEKVEYVRCIDDAYLLIGKANFYKKDFFASIETFNYIIKQYKNNPIKYDAYLWLARTYIEMGKFDKGENFLSSAQNDKKEMPKKLIAPFQLTWADLMLKQKRYSDAIPFLEKAIEHTKQKKDKARYYYILAQIYQMLEDNKKAGDSYKNVIALNPKYEMAFNAKINHASVFNSETDNSKNLVKELEKMLKDDKNIDYQDQIYYALANIAFNEGDKKQAIEYYLLSAHTSKKNDNQKALSYLALADIYFAEPVYKNAQMYYDSTMSFLSNKYPNYLQLKRKSENLNELIDNINTVTLQDSLLVIANKSESERNRIIDQVIAEVIRKEQEEKEAEAQRQRDLAQLQQNSYELNRTTGGKWYFYNPAMLSSGLAEFKKKWGSRKLEDNWRRKNKQEISGDLLSDDDQATEDSTKAKKYDIKSREYYLAQLPLTHSAKEVSLKNIEDAMFNIANLYKDKFYDYKQSIKSYEDLFKRFPQTDYLLRSYYSLYKIFLHLKNEPKTEEYKNKIINLYPDSDYARILKDPEYFKELENKNKQIHFLYQATYKYFLVSNCEEVHNNFTYADSIYPKNKLIPKFALLNTLCIGNNKDTAFFKARLNTFISKYPDTEEEGYAKEVLAALDREPHKIEEVSESEEEKVVDLFNDDAQPDSIDYSMFTVDKDAEHYYMAIVANEKTEPTKVLFGLSDFNIDYYNFLDFDVSKEVISAKYTALIVSKFKNAKMASNYFESVIIANEVLQNVDKTTVRLYTISKQNLETFKKDKNIFRYHKFFEDNYPNLSHIKY